MEALQSSWHRASIEGLVEELGSSALTITDILRTWTER